MPSWRSDDEENFGGVFLPQKGLSDCEDDL